jgi:hypothetical protein
MPSTVRSDRSSQIVGWAVLSLFIAGNFLSVVGAWTGPVTGVWFVGTQKPRRGFLWLLAFTFFPGLFSHWRKFPHDGPEHAILYLALALLTAVLAILPLTYHRLVSPRLAGFFSTLPFPLATVAIPALALALHAGVVPQAGPKTLLIAWFAATLVWMWNRESRATTAFLGAGVVLATALELIAHFTDVALPAVFPNGTIAGCACLGGALFLAVWALFHPIRERSWADRREALVRLQSPFTGDSLQVAGEPGHEALVSSSGERFPVLNGIPTFLKPQDLTGDNGKYNHLYELIGGFYNDIQRVSYIVRSKDSTWRIIFSVTCVCWRSSPAILCWRLQWARDSTSNICPTVSNFSASICRPRCWPTAKSICAAGGWMPIFSSAMPRRFPL